MIYPGKNTFTFSYEAVAALLEDQAVTMLDAARPVRILLIQSTGYPPAFTITFTTDEEEEEEEEEEE